MRNPELYLRYTAALSRLQSVMAYDIFATIDAHVSEDGRWEMAKLLKKLVTDTRVGVNSAMSTHSELVQLLILKGVITSDEYEEVLAVSTEREASEREADIRKKHSVPDNVRFV